MKNIMTLLLMSSLLMSCGHPIIKYTEVDERLEGNYTIREYSYRNHDYLMIGRGAVTHAGHCTNLKHCCGN